MTTTKIVLGILAMMVMLVIPSVAQEENVTTTNNTTVNDTEWLDFVANLEVMPASGIITPPVVNTSVYDISIMGSEIFETLGEGKTAGGLNSESAATKTLTDFAKTGKTSTYPMKIAKVGLVNYNRRA